MGVDNMPFNRPKLEHEFISCSATCAEMLGGYCRGATCPYRPREDWVVQQQAALLRQLHSFAKDLERQALREMPNTYARRRVLADIKFRTQNLETNLALLAHTTEAMQ